MIIFKKILKIIFYSIIFKTITLAIFIPLLIVIKPIELLSVYIIKWQIPAIDKRRNKKNAKKLKNLEEIFNVG